MNIRRRMRRFWDQRAEEDAFYFVDNRLDYRDADLDSFWAGGEKDLDGLLTRLGVELNPRDLVVEIGCGVGRLTRPIAARAGQVLAVDVSERMLALARHHNPDLGNVRWLLGDGSSLSGIDDSSADVCISHVVFQHIPDPRITMGYVREMGRVLRPRGRAAFQVSNAPAVHRSDRGVGAMRRRLRAALGRAPRGQADPAWLGSAIDLGELRHTATGTGLRVDRIVGEGTQFCLVALTKPAIAPSRPTAAAP